MQMFIPSGAAITVSAIYCVWNAWHIARRQRERLLRERVAYMLWVACDLAA
jgi:hypothetical protein